MRRNYFNALTLLFLCVVFGVSSASAQQTLYVDAIAGDDTYDGTSPTDQGGGIGPFQTLQFAMMMANNSDTLRVAAGVYDGYQLVDKELTILGANSGVPGNGTRGAESILTPDNTDITFPSNSSNSLVQITRSNVVLDGFLIDGDNPNVSSNNDVNGADVDYSNAVIVFGDFNNVRIRNNRIENFNNAGIEALGNIVQPNGDCSFNHNSFYNFNESSTGIICGNGFYAEVSNNLFNVVSVGVSLYDFTTAGKRPITINNNTFAVNYIGIVLTGINQNASNVYIEENNISALTGNVAFQGLSLRNCSANSNLEVRKNRISNFDQGVFMLEVDMPVKAFVNDTIVDCAIGLENVSGLTRIRTDSIAIERSVISSSTTTAVRIASDSAETKFHSNETVYASSTDGIQALGNVHLMLDTSVFDAITDYYIHFDTTASHIYSSMDIDATQCIFDGERGSTATHNNNFTIEDKIRHHLDEVEFPYVSFKDGSAYVSGFDNNTSMNRAIAKASDDWSILVRDINTSEDVLANKQLFISTFDNVRVGTLTIDTTGKQVFINDTLYVTNGLSLNNGVLNTTGGLVHVGEQLFTSAAGNVSFSAGSYVNGPLALVVGTSGTDNLSFPIGSSTSIRPVLIELTNATPGAWDVITAELKENQTPNRLLTGGLSHVSDIHYWQITTANAVNHDNVVYTASYSTDGRDDEANDAANLVLANENSGNWDNLGGPGTADDIGVITSSNNTNVVSDLVLANAKNGSNKLGKDELIGAFVTRDGCDGDIIAFNNNSTALVGTIVLNEWDFGDTSSTDTSTRVNPSYIYTGPGLYTVRLIVATDSGARDTTYQQVEVFAKPDVGFTEAIPCFPQACTFSDTTKVQAPDDIEDVLWKIEGNEYFSSIAGHSFSATGTYTVTLIITTENGCLDSATKQIFQGDSVKMQITPAGPISICEGDDVQLTATTGIQTYSWSTGASTNSVTVNQSGTYRVDGRNSNLCFGSDSVVVNTVPAPVADAGSDVFIEYGESTTLMGTGGGTYLWSPATALDNPTIDNPTASPTSTTTYVLTVTNAQGCTDTDSVTVTVALPKKIDIPNILSPNDDGYNDTWDLSGVPDVDQSKITVLNRWGKVVFETENYQHDWDGTYNGEPLPDGTYMYIIEGSDVYDAFRGPLQITR